MWPFRKAKPITTLLPDTPVAVTEARVFYYTDVHGPADHLLAHSQGLLLTDFSKLTARVTARIAINSFSTCLPQLVLLFKKQNELIRSSQHAAITALAKHYQVTAEPVNLEFYLADQDALPIDVYTHCSELHKVLADHVGLVAKHINGNFYYQRLSMPLYQELFEFLRILDKLEDTAMD